METPTNTTLLRRLRSNPLASTFTLLVTLTVGVLAGSVLTKDVGAKEQQKVDSSDARPLVIPDPKTLSNGFSTIVKQVGPAVVNINTETIAKKAAAPKTRRGGKTDPNGEGPNQGDMQDFFNKFFGGQGGGGGDEDDDGAGGERQALGSGFIVDSRGYIITNNHVVDKADKIYVKLAGDPDDGQRLQGRPATVIGVDPETDIAVIKIDTKTPLPTIKLGNSDSAEVGDWVLAIGSPFSLSETVTAGIVSAKNRSIDEPGPNGAPNQFQKFIQTDAAINPGNSGGPLVDMAGQVIGMNTAIYTQSMGSQGVGFAMPSNIIASIYNMLISPDHKVVRGSIGISFQGNESSAVSRVYGFANGGVLVNTVTPNGPAAKGGVKPGDVIVAIDGKPIKDGDQLVADISARKVGSTVSLGVQRNGSRENLTVAIADSAKLFADNGAQADDSSAPTESDAGEGKLGIKVDPIPSALASKLGVKGGVIVTSVRPGSFADEVNLTKGTVITAINRRPIPDEAAYRSIVSSLKSGDDVAFEVRGSSSPANAGPSYVGGTLP